MKQHKDTLIQIGSAVRVKDGVAIPEPTENKYKGNGRSAVGATNQLTKAWKSYEDAEEKAVVCSMVEFVKKCSIGMTYKSELSWYFKQTTEYMVSLSAKPTLSDFICCNEKGEPLEEPDFDKIPLNGDPDPYATEYAKACERVVFDGWELYSIQSDKQRGITRIKRKGERPLKLEVLFWGDGNVRLCVGASIYNNPTVEEFTRQTTLTLK